MRFQIQSVFFYFATQPAWLRYGLALITVIATTTATLYIPLIGERAAFLLFFLGIAQASFWLGLKPSVLTAALSLIAVNTFVLFPTGIEPHKILILNAGFCFVSAVMIATTSFNRQLAEALRESRQDLNHAQSVGKIGSWRMNVQRNQLQWSDQNYRIFGIPQDTPMTYETFLDAVHPEDRDYVDKMWQVALSGEPYDIEHRIMIAGQVKWVREKASLEFDKKGKLIGGFGITQDITECKHNELALIESWQRYAGIVESSMDAIVTLDEDQHIILFNNAAAAMFGHSADEAVGLSIERFIPVGFPPDQRGSMKTNIPTGNQYSKTEKRVAVKALRASGEEFSVEASISQRIVAGKPCYTLILRDVTERMRTEFSINERLRLQDQLTKVAATVPGVICSFRLRPDGSASMPYASPIFQSLYGISHDTVIDDFGPVFARTHPDDIGHIHDTVAESARTLQPWRDAFRYNHPTKGEIWIEGHSMPQREADGSILWHGYVQDVTERKQAQDELRESEARLALIIDEAKAGCWDWNPLTSELFISSESKRQIGFEDNLLNRWEEWESRLHPDDRAMVWATAKNYISGHQQNYDLEFRLKHKDGAYRWIHSRGGLLRDQNKRPSRMLGINLDVTDYKKQKEINERRVELEQSFQLHVAVQTAAAIAHELNQPLTAICSYADVATHILQTGDPNPEKLSQIMENCSLQAQRAGKVIRQLLTVLQKGETTSEAMDINTSVHKAIEIVEADGLLDVFKIKMNLTVNLPPVMANALQVQKVLINLVRNGLESMQIRGKGTGILTVTTRPFDVDPAMALVTVCDSGAGVADTATLKKIFQPFYTTKTTGLGMGLAISRALIEAHGGKLWAEQNADIGISIHFTLPFEG